MRRVLQYLQDVPIWDWIVKDGGCLDVDECPDCWERNAHLERYDFARRVFLGGRVLDFGCGVGYGSEMLAGAGNTVVGVDASLTALIIARERREQFATFVLPSDPLAQGPFLGTVAFEVLEHLEYPEEFLEQVARFSKHLVISTPVVPSVAHNPHHKRDFTPAEFRAMIERRFEIVTEWWQVRPFRKEPCYAVIHGAGR
ncbi:MAG: methyltransferase domain-containing protein [Acidobacteriia bacterium]|nr:methyltransferase domain-containing protein [Terriglobia bacterium]